MGHAVQQRGAGEPPTRRRRLRNPAERGYDLIDIDRERINGQAVLQFRASDSLTATVDFTYSRHEVEVRDSSVGIWFNFGDVSSEWTDGPNAAPLFYAENFGPGKDLSYSQSLTANASENKSLGGNLTWEAPGGVTVTLDAHHSTAESKPSNEYGSRTSIGAALSASSRSDRLPGDLRSSPIRCSRASTRGTRAYHPDRQRVSQRLFSDEINQGQLRGHYDHEGDFLRSIDAGFSFVDNRAIRLRLHPE